MQIKNERHRVLLASKRDVSEYQANERAPTDEDMRWIISHLLSLAAHKPDNLACLRRYVVQWTFWLRSGLTALGDLKSSVETYLPSFFPNWAILGCGSDRPNDV